ncbi:MAG: alpha/beta fold hydrolase [Actinomycetota bacterium]|nr:alpha/beta fold hydrolase [Actinomycetota bacterium]
MPPRCCSEERHEDCHGLQLFVTEYGPAEAPLTISLAHCWMLDQEDWHYPVRALQQEFGHRVRVVTWDHRGHGRSEACAKAACTTENLARDLAALSEELAPSGPLLLAGHSIGAMTILALAEQRPELFVRVIERQVVRRFVFGRPIRLADSALTVDVSQLAARNRRRVLRGLHAPSALRRAEGVLRDPDRSAGGCPVTCSGPLAHPRALGPAPCPARPGPPRQLCRYVGPPKC